MATANAYKKILVAVDLSEDAHQVLQRAQELAGCFGASLELIHVIEPVALNSPYELSPSLPSDMQSVLVQRAEEFLSRLTEEYGSADMPHTVHLGSIKQSILDTAKTSEIDLIVIGTHGRHGIGLLLGSTATLVLHGTPCDIHAVRVQ